MHHQEPWVILRTWFLDVLESQASIEEIIQQRGQRHVSRPNTSAESVAHAWSVICTLHVAVARKQLWRRLPGIARERAYEAWVGTDVQNAAAGPYESTRFTSRCTPIFNVRVDEGGIDGVERSISKGSLADISLDQRAHIRPAPGERQLVTRDVHTDDGPTKLRHRGQVQTATTPKLQTAPWTWSKPRGNEWCCALGEARELLVVPPCVRVVERPTAALLGACHPSIARPEIEPHQANLGRAASPRASYERCGALAVAANQPTRTACFTMTNAFGPKVNAATRRKE